MSSGASKDQVPWFLKSSCPVLLPYDEALVKPRAEFDAYVGDILQRRHDADSRNAAAVEPVKAMTDVTASDSFTELTPSTTADVRERMGTMVVDDSGPASPSATNAEATGTAKPFMDGLASFNTNPTQPANMENKTLTQNGDVAYLSTTDALVDLFAELEDTVSGARLQELLTQAWAVDSLATLKIIFNARSIHLGKASRHTFYRCAGWLAQNHPRTLVANLRWLSRPLIRKKAKKDGEEEDVVLVEADEKDEDYITKHDVKFGVAHGYWKDMLNILALAADGTLGVLQDPRALLNQENPTIVEAKKRGKASDRGRGRGRGRARTSRGTLRGTPRGMYRGTVRPRGGLDHGRGGSSASTQTFTTASRFSAIADTEMDPEREEKVDESEDEQPVIEDDPSLPKFKQLRRQIRAARHQAAVRSFEKNPVYRSLHLTVARLFAEQLRADLAALRGEDAAAKRNISLCAKWAPSHDHFHDRHTFIVSSIAEALYPRECFGPDELGADANRETYLRHARDRYRKSTASLRAHLAIVERDLTAGTYSHIRYERVPSLAMKQYSKLFMQKDFGRFEAYIERVASGKANISGATLLPSTLVHTAMKAIGSTSLRRMLDPDIMTPKQLMDHKTSEIEAKVLNGQWETLVRRIRESGTMSSSIAVCDVSGSMGGPLMYDGTCPMDTAIGLSLLVAEVTAKPFGGGFITFSQRPAFQTVDLSAPLVDKVAAMKRANWGMNTNFVAVFQNLILPMALKNKLRADEMVKRVFVFSDMHFDSAELRSDGPQSCTWGSSYEVIKADFEKAGYEMPELVFWNLASAPKSGGIAPKPVSTNDVGTSLVSGYSQGMLKVFLDNGGFEEEEEEDESEDAMEVTKDGEVVVPKKKTKMSPLGIVMKAISHESYNVFQVFD